MTRLRSFRCAAVVTAAIGLVTPRCALLAAEKAPAKKLAVADVALDQSGDLAGSVVSAEGESIDGAIVTLSKQGRAVAKTTTDEAGAFELDSVKSGTYELKVGNSVRLVRVWKSDAAPPTALDSARLVVGPTVRGQEEYYDMGGVDFITLSTLATSAGALAIGIVNQSDINNVQDDIDDLATP